MAKARTKRERDQWDDLPDKINFKRLTQDEVLGHGWPLEQPTGRASRKALEAEPTEHLGYEKNDNAGGHGGTAGITVKRRHSPKIRKRLSLFPDTGTGRSIRE
jgi:hypothetical protein